MSKKGRTSKYFVLVEQIGHNVPHGTTHNVNTEILGQDEGRGEEGGCFPWKQ